MTVSINNGNIIRVSHGEDPNSGIFFTFTDDDNPHFKINYLSVMTGWGSIGLWRFQEVTEPRHIHYRVEDDDQCLQERNSWGSNYFCATNGAEWCDPARGWAKDTHQCCPCTCNPELCKHSY